MNDIFSKLYDPYYYELVSTCLNDGSFNRRDIPVLYRLFKDKEFSHYHKLKHSLFSALKKYSHLLDYTLLSDSLGCQVNQLPYFIESQPIIADFPIVRNDYSDISKVHLYPTVYKDFPLTFPNCSQEIFQALYAIQKFTGKNFFLSFESEPFTDTSFSLSVAAALLLKDAPLKNFIFSGVVDSQGNVYNVAFMKEKSDKAHSQKRYLVSYPHIQHLNELSCLNVDTLNIPFIQLFGKSQNDLQNSFSSICSMLSQSDTLLPNILGVKLSDTTLYLSSFIENDLDKWDTLLGEFVEKVKIIYSLPYHINLHLLGTLSAFAFGMGVILGAKRSFAIYHFQDSKFIKLFDFIGNSARSLKSKTKPLNILNDGQTLEFKYIECKIEKVEGSSEVAVIIHFASHNPGKDSEEFVEDFLKSSSAKISLKERLGNIPIDNIEIWICIVSELYSLIDMLPDILNKRLSKFHFIFSVPVPVAFGLGMALGDYKNIAVYNFDKISDEKGSYKKVLDSQISKNFRNFF